MSDAEGYQAIAEADVEAARHRPARTLGQRLRWPLMIGGPAVILALTAYFVVTGRQSAATDDAYVQVSRAAISSSVAGRVVEIDVQENQAVRKGQTLFKLDAADYAVAQARAEAELAAARDEVQMLRATYRQRQVEELAARLGLAYVERQARRQKDMAAIGASSAAQADEAEHQADLVRRQIAILHEQAGAARAQLGAAVDGSVESHPRVLQAKAALERARLDLGYAAVTAPVDGIVAKVEQLQVGNRVAPSQTLFWLVSGRPWVEANFKEDQLARMRIGQPATVTVDAYDKVLNGRVASFAPGTGASFALLPAENATGNWVKVVQRVPVRIVLEGTPPNLSAGLSARVKVDLRDNGRP